MDKGLIYVNTDTASAFEAIAGNTIAEAVDEDNVVEVVTIRTFRQIENVKVGQNVCFEDDQCFLSGEYIYEIGSDDMSELDKPEEEETSLDGDIEMSEISLREAAEILRDMVLYRVFQVFNDQDQHLGTAFIFQTNADEDLNKFRCFRVLNNGTYRISGEY